MPFISLIVHEDIQKLSDSDQIYLMQNADNQFPNSEIFKLKQLGVSTIERLFFLFIELVSRKFSWNI